MNRQQFDSTFARLTQSLHSLQNRSDSSIQINHQLENGTNDYDKIKRQEEY